MRRLLILVAAVWMMPACSSTDEAVIEAATPKEVDLSAFERRRAGSSGAAVEQAVADERSAGAQKVYASTEDEPTLIDMENAGEETPAGLGSGGGDDNAAGSSSPTDLDRASEEIGPWIDMNLVGQTIRSQNRSLKSCFSEHAPSSAERRVDVRLTVNTAGKCTKAKIDGTSPTRGAGLDRCIGGVLKKAKFPEAREGDKSFSYVLRF